MQRIQHRAVWAAALPTTTPPTQFILASGPNWTCPPEGPVVWAGPPADKSAWMAAGKWVCKWRGKQGLYTECLSPSHPVPAPTLVGLQGPALGRVPLCLQRGRNHQHGPGASNSGMCCPSRPLPPRSIIIPGILASELGWDRWKHCLTGTPWPEDPRPEASPRTVWRGD